MAETFMEGVRRVSRHEAGHYIVGEVNGFAMGQLRYIPGKEAGAQGMFIRPVKNLEDVLQLIDQRAEVLLAGVIAETWDSDDKVWSQKANQRFTEEGARQDKAKFAELLYLRQSIVGTADVAQHQKGISQHESKLAEDCARKIADNIEIVLELAEKFGKRLDSTDLSVTMERAEIEALPKFKERFLRAAG